jgi:hypothetical protein
MTTQTNGERPDVTQALNLNFGAEKMSFSQLVLAATAASNSL